MRLPAIFAGLAMACAVAAPLSSAPQPARPQVAVDAPVDIDELLRAVRIQAALSADTFYKYTYRQTVTDEDLAEDGSVTRRETSAYRVIPSRDGTERHLLSRDGEPPSAAEIRKEEKRNAALKRRLEKMREKRAQAVARRKAAAPAPAPARPAPPATASASPAATPPASPPPSPAPASPGSTESVTRAAAATAVAETKPTPAEPFREAPAAASPPPRLPAIVTAPLPACDLDDVESSLRPPLPGSRTKSGRSPSLGTEQARRSREKTSDYSLWELLQLTDYELAGACELDGRPMHVLTFEPPDSFDPVNPVERVMTAMAGTLLIDGRDLQVQRAEGATVAPIKWGAGMVSLRSAHVLLEYAKVGGEIWLPSRDVFEYDSRVVFDNQRQRFTHVFDDFAKATVSVEEEFDYVPAD